MGSRIEITPAWTGHVRYVANNARVSDCEEAHAAYGPMDMLTLLTRSVKDSTMARAAVDMRTGRPVAIFGVAPYCLLGAAGAVWLIGTDEVERHPRAMLELGRDFVGRMHGPYAELVNYVSAGHHAALRWLGRLGFEVLPARPYGYARQPFHPVIHRRTPCVTQVS